MKTLTTPLKLITLLMIIGLGSPKAFAQPANDHITNATNLSLGPIMFLDENVAFTEATIAGDSGQQGCGTGTAGIWYKFTATAEGVIGAGIEPFAQPVIVFYSAENENATSGEDLTYVDQQTNPCENSNFSSIVTTIGTTYYIFFKNDVDANVMINLDQVFAIPSNDYIENATGLNGLEDYFEPEIHFLMVSDTNDGGQIGGCDTQSTPGIWYKFTTEGDGQVVAGLSTPANGSAIIFFSAENENATTGSDLTYIDQPTNPCDTGNLRSIQATANTTYYVFVGTALPNADFSINLSGILGASDNSIPGFTYYPNPATDEIHLNALHPIENVAFYNVLGQQVYSEKIDLAQSNVNLAFLESGLYVMSITSEGKTANYKVVKK